MVFERNRSTASQILTICRILEEVRTKSLEATLLFVDFSKTFESQHRGKMEQILLVYGLPKEIVFVEVGIYSITDEQNMILCLKKVNLFSYSTKHK